MSQTETQTEIKFQIFPEDLTTYYSENPGPFSPSTFSTVMYVILGMLFLTADITLSLVAMFMNDGSIKVDSINILPRLIILIVLCAVFFVTSQILSKAGFRKMAKSKTGKQGLFCEHTLTISDEGFTESTEVNRCFHSWEGIEEVSESKSFVLIKVRQGSVYFIPKRSFSDDASITEFVKTGNDYIEAVSE